MSKMKCQDCGLTGSEEDFKPAERIELRHALGDPFSNLECHECGALAYPENTDSHYVVVHDYGDGMSVHEFRSSEDEAVLTNRDSLVRIATVLDIDYEPHKHEDLLVVRLEASGALPRL